MEATKQVYPLSVACPQCGAEKDVPCGQTDGGIMIHALRANLAAIPKRGAYTLTLTSEDVRTIAFVGGRYDWSASLIHLEMGENALTEWEAWEIRDAFDADTAGSHSMFPMLDHQSELAGKLIKLWNEIV